MTDEQIVIPEEVVLAGDLAREAAALEIKTKEDVERAAEWAGQLNAANRRAEEARIFLVRPLNEHVSRINAEFKPRTTAIGDALAILKRKIAAFHREATEREQAAIRAAAEFVGASKEVADIASSRRETVAARAPSATAAVSSRWDYEVVDLKRLCKAIADGEADVALVTPARGELRKLLNERMKGEGEPTMPPGVKVTREDDVRLT